MLFENMPQRSQKILKLEVSLPHMLDKVNRPIQRPFPQKFDKIFLAIGETILGIPQDELGNQFVEEVNRYVGSLDSYLRKDIRLLVAVFNSRISVFFRTLALKPFHALPSNKREKYLDAWKTSRIPLLRTGYVALRSLSGWAYYSSDKGAKEMGSYGKTIGKEQETPTLLSKKFYPNSPIAGGQKS